MAQRGEGRWGTGLKMSKMKKEKEEGRNMRHWFIFHSDKVHEKQEQENKRAGWWEIKKERTKD